MIDAKRQFLRLTSEMGEKEFQEKAVSLREKAVSTCLACGAGLMEAEDVAQDVLLRLWQLRDTLERYRSLEALVVVMARHNLASLRRKEVGVPIMSINSKQLQSQLLPPDDSAMRRLPGTQYAVRHMRQVECLSYDEIASRLGIESSTARSLLSKARFKLLDEIKKRNLR